jgi:hypothetical protein
MNLIFDILIYPATIFLWQYFQFKSYKKSHNLTQYDIRKANVNNPRSKKTNFYYSWFWPYL